MRYASLFSGIDAASVAFKPLGWKCEFFSEIERFPNRVLSHHYPDVPNYGDITKYDSWPQHEIDLIIGGSPCQSFSNAGKRQGLNDPRGQLMFAYLGAVKKYHPRWVVWENVPGVLSSGGGRDFASFLQGLEKLGYSCAWRVLDAQSVRTDRFPHALPQRRRRIFLVGYLGDWRCAAKVLFERESLSGHPAPRRETKQTSAGQTAYRLVSHGEYTETTIASTIKERDYKSATDLIVFDAKKVGDKVVPVSTKQGYHDFIYVCKTTNTKSNGLGISDKGVAYTLDTSPNQAITTEGFVRRLTPTECERLMGFPDGYTNIEGASDTARYKALGNSMAVNCIDWLGKKISWVEKRRRIHVSV